MCYEDEDRLAATRSAIESKRTSVGGSVANDAMSVRNTTPTVRKPNPLRIGNGDNTSAEKPNTVVIPDTLMAFPTRVAAV